MEKKIRIILADDHPIIRKGLKEIIADIPGIVVIDEAENGNELLRKMKNYRYDMIILDISMPDLSGIDAIKQIKRIDKSVKVLVFSIYSEDHYAVRFLKAGAHGYLQKICESSEIIEAVKSIADGRKYFSNEVYEKFILNMEKNFVFTPHELLSNREYEIMILFASGKKSSEIASELDVSEKTVSTYKKRILDKMNMKKYAELVKYVVENKLI